MKNRSSTFVCACAAAFLCLAAPTSRSRESTKAPSSEDKALPGSNYDLARAVEICNDGIDNNRDGKVDYEDRGCKPPGTTYFVSSSLGNDAWDGKAPIRESDTRGPKKSADAIASLLNAAVPGDVILLKRGDEWSVTSIEVHSAGGEEEKPIILGAYGVGSEPVLVRDSAAIGSTLLIRGSYSDVSEYLVIENLVVTSDKPSPDLGDNGIWVGEGCCTGDGADRRKPHHITIRRCLVENNNTGVLIVDNLDVDGSLSDITVEDCVIRNNTYPSYTVEEKSLGLYVCADRVTVRGNLFDNNGYVGNGYSWDAYVQCRSDVLIEQNEFANSYTGLKIGRMAGAIVRDNIFHDIDITAMTVGGDEGGPSTDIIIERNRFYACGQALVIKDQDTGANGPTEGVIVRNNLFYQNSESDSESYPNAYVWVRGTAPVEDAYIYNNVFYDILGKKCLVLDYHAESSVSVRNNIFWKGAKDNPPITDSLGADIAYNLFVEPREADYDYGTNAIFGNPRFKNAPLGDFRLTSASVLAIDEGADAAGIVDDDCAGKPRPFGAGWDIGAYEYFYDFSVFEREDVPELP